MMKQFNYDSLEMRKKMRKSSPDAPNRKQTRSHTHGCPFNFCEYVP